MKENNNLEFKEKYANTFLKTVSAYANYGNGEIIFGVDDKGNVKGLTDLKQTSLSIENAINDAIKPVPKFEILVDEKLNTVTLKVFKGLNKPYFYQSKAYKRSFTSTVEVDRFELTRLIMEGQNISYDSLLSEKKDLNFSVLTNKLKDKLQIEHLSQDVLITLGLYVKNEGYTIAGELLSDNNSYRGIDLVRFGSSNNVFLDRAIYEKSSILEEYDLAVEKIKQYYTYEEIQGLNRVKVENIPEEAYREVLANALVHRSWDINSQIKVEMYDDRIEIISPGGLPKGLSEEDYLSGNISILRNPIIADVFFRLGLIEKFGTGIQRVLESYSKSLIKPGFVFSENYIKVTLPKIEVDYPEITKDEEVVYRIIENKELSSSQVSNLADFGKTKTLEILNKLVDQGYAEKTGKARATRYKARKVY